MKFSIGIESISLNYEDEGKMLKEVENYGEESINDNMFHLEIQDYNSAMESINAEVDILLKQSYSIVGTEADDTAKKDPIYKRIWKAIKKMFETLGDWTRRTLDFIIDKFFRKGAKNSTSEVSEAVIKTKMRVISKTMHHIKQFDKYTKHENTSIKTIVDDAVKTESPNSEIKEIVKSDIEELVNIVEDNITTEEVPEVKNDKFTYELSYLGYSDKMMHSLEKYKGNLSKLHIAASSIIKETAKDSMDILAESALTLAFYFREISALISLGNESGIEFGSETSTNIELSEANKTVEEIAKASDSLMSKKAKVLLVEKKIALEFNLAVDPARDYDDIFNKASTNTDFRAAFKLETEITNIFENGKSMVDELFKSINVLEPKEAIDKDKLAILRSITVNINKILKNLIKIIKESTYRRLKRRFKDNNFDK